MAGISLHVLPALYLVGSGDQSGSGVGARVRDASMPRGNPGRTMMSVPVLLGTLALFVHAAAAWMFVP